MDTSKLDSSTVTKCTVIMSVIIKMCTNLKMNTVCSNSNAPKFLYPILDMVFQK